MKPSPSDIHKCPQKSTSLPLLFGKSSLPTSLADNMIATTSVEDIEVRHLLRFLPSIRRYCLHVYTIYDII